MITQDNSQTVNVIDSKMKEHILNGLRSVVDVNAGKLRSLDSPHTLSLPSSPSGPDLVVPDPDGASLDLPSPAQTLSERSEQ